MSDTRITPAERRDHEVQPEHPPAADADEQVGIGEHAPEDDDADRQSDEQVR